MSIVSRLIVFLSCIIVLAVPAIAQDERVQVVASHSILGDVVQNIVGDVADVSIIMRAGSDPHSFEPSPSDLTAVADADIVFVNGAFFEEGLLESIENAGEMTDLIEVSACVEIIAYGAGSHDEHAHDEDEHAHDEDEHGHDDEHEHDEDLSELCAEHVAEFENLNSEHEHEHDDDHEHKETLGRLYQLDCDAGHGHDEEGDEHADEDEHGHDHSEGGCDSHVWMNPHNVIYWTLLIRDTMIDLDETNADTYRANADAYVMTLEALMHDVVEPQVKRIPEVNRILITSHDSLGYLAHAFDFEVISTIIPAGTTIAEPSASDIAEVIDLINAEGVPAIFGETTVSTSIAQAIASETGAELVVLYSGSLSDADDPASTYVDYISYNYTAIADALSGDS